jgi:hypothetical protein
MRRAAVQTTISWEPIAAAPRRQAAVRRDRAARLRGTRSPTTPGTAAIRPWSAECDRAGSSRQIERRAVHPVGVGTQDAEGPSSWRNSRRPGVMTLRASTTLPQRHSGHVRPPARWQTFRFRSGLLRMPPAGLEPATRCLEGASRSYGLPPYVAQTARRCD